MSDRASKEDADRLLQDVFARARYDFRRPKGECQYCDRYRDEPMAPSHTASPNCQSGKRAHCTCDTCF